MTIKRKQFLTFFFVAVSLFTILFMIGFFTVRYQKIQQEKEILTNLNLKVYKAVSSTSYQVMQESLTSFFEDEEGIQRELEEAFLLLDDVVILPRTSDEIQKAVLALKSFQTMAIRRFLELKNMRHLVEELSVGDLSIIELSLSDDRTGGDPDSLILIVNEIIGTQRQFGLTMEYISREINSQIGIINDSLDKVFRKNQVFMSLSLVILSLFSLLLSRRFACRLTRDIESISSTLSEMRHTSEPVRFSIRRKDELGLLAENIDEIFHELTEVRNHLKELVEQRTKALSEEIEQREMAEEDLLITLNSIGDGVIATDRNGKITRMNPVAEALTGFALSEVRGIAIDEVVNMEDSQQGTPLDDPVFRVLQSGQKLSYDCDIMLINRRGEEFFISQSASPILSDDNQLLGAVLIFQDITEKSRMRNQLSHTQKMDAIGQLAGGVAHDFNNMLGGIIGAADLMAPMIEDNPEAQEMRDVILEAAEKASGLIRQLLTFAHKERATFSRVDLHQIIRNAESILRRTIDRRIDIKLDLQAHLSVTEGDASLLQSALLNLGINASHAMSGGGTLSFHTAEIELDREYCSASSFEIEPGKYIRLTVKDTGSGIPKRYLARIFEPFFTTKEKGKGTGMGLASVYGTISRHKGAIAVESEAGKGTSFIIDLPVSVA